MGRARMSGVIGRVAALARRPRSGALPDSASILAAFTMPAVLLGGENRLRFVNSAGELFFQLSQSSRAGISLAELLPPDNRLFALIDQVHCLDSPVADHDLTLESPRLHRAIVSAYRARWAHLRHGSAPGHRQCPASGGVHRLQVPVGTRDLRVA
jgi:two-component system nitrogen regulation sensor histidine kinase GlnL